ncbi:glycosyltransferase, partial [Candidatus Roizmanbacteria bacterium]|nr:glycosyltransferase [Candidatus Roizmanbacteria bacterium]
KRFIEVLVVDDGSTDSSRDIIKKQYLSTFPKFRLVENHHQGKAFAIIRGIQEARGTHVIFTDIDLATPIEEVEKLISVANSGYNIVMGSRESKREGAPLSRKVLALGFIVIRNVVFGLKGIRDTQCGFKLFETKAAQNIINKLILFKKQHTIKGSSVSAAFDLEFVFLASRFKYKIKEVPVEWRHVETKNVNFFKDAIETIKDLARIKYYDLRGLYV